MGYDESQPGLVGRNMSGSSGEEIDHISESKGSDRDVEKGHDGDNIGKSGAVNVCLRLMHVFHCTLPLAANGCAQQDDVQVDVSLSLSTRTSCRAH